MNNLRTRPSPVQRPGPSMDVARERRRGLPKYVYALGVALVLVALLVWAIGSLSKANAGGPVVDKSTLVTDVAKKGTLVRAVSAEGTFAPEHVRVASAAQDGVVNQIFVKPGSAVQPGSVIAQMQNPALVAAVVDARAQVAVAQANLASAEQQAHAAIITQQTALSDQQSALQQDRLQASSLSVLHGKGLVANVAYKQALIQAQKSANDVRSSRAQVAVSEADARAKVAAARAQLAQAQAQLAADSAQVNALTVRSAADGVVQSVDVDPGTSITQTAEIARIADTHSLKAVLQVAEGDVHAVLVGMPAQIDTGDGVITGRVTRIAPAAQNGTVAVDVTFSRPLPAGARPDANVDGTIDIASIPNAISIARPAGASDDSTIDLFKVVDGGTRAVRTRVRLGQGSSDRVQVLAGVRPDDVVIVSDMSNYLDQPAVRLR